MASATATAASSPAALFLSSFQQPSSSASASASASSSSIAGLPFSSSAFEPPSAIVPPQDSTSHFNSDQEGSRFGPGLRYALGKVIGHGGSSTVREGWDLDNSGSSGGGGGDPTQRRRVAIKVVSPPPTSTEPSSQQQPTDEPALWKTLPNHPHILPLLYHQRIGGDEHSSSSSSTTHVELFVMPFCNRGNLLKHVRTEAGRRSLPTRTPRLSRAGTLTSMFAGVTQSPSTIQRGGALPDTESAESHPLGVTRSLSLNGPDQAFRPRHPSTTGPPFEPSQQQPQPYSNMRIVTPSKAGSLPRDTPDSLARLSIVPPPASTEISPNGGTTSRDSESRLPYMSGGARSPTTAASPSTSFISRHGSIRSIGSTRSRQAGVSAAPTEWPSRGVPLRAAREILRQLADALSVLHCQSHLVHGDLKLENVLGQAAGPTLRGALGHGKEGAGDGSTDSEDAMEVLRGCGLDAQSVTEEDEEICWRIADFGLSRRVGEDAHTAPEALKLAVDRGGTLPYAAPELLRERVQESNTSPTAAASIATNKTDSPAYPSPDSDSDSNSNTAGSPYASDMWSLGCILYALLSGRLPFVDSFEPRLQAKIVKGEWEMPGRLRRARERRAAAAVTSAGGGGGGLGFSQRRDSTSGGGGGGGAAFAQRRDSSSDSPMSAWSLRARTASADQSSAVLEDGGPSAAFSRFSRPSPTSNNGGGGGGGGGAHSWFPSSRSGSQPGTMRRIMSPTGLGRMSSLTRVGREGDSFGNGSSISSSMFRGSSPLRESVLLDLHDLSASMPALSPALGLGRMADRAAAAAAVDALQPSVELGAAGPLLETDQVDSDAEEEEGHDVEWDGRSVERAAAREVLGGLLQPDPNRRWTVERLVRCRWLGAEFAPDDGAASTASASAADPFRRSLLFRRMSEDEREGVPASLLAIVEDLRAAGGGDTTSNTRRGGVAEGEKNRPWRRFPEPSPSPLPPKEKETTQEAPPLLFERRPVSVERGNRRASSLTRTRPPDDLTISSSSSRERLPRPRDSVEEEHEGEAGEENERVGRLGRDGRTPRLDRFFMAGGGGGAGVRSRSTSRLLEPLDDGTHERGEGVDSSNTELALRGRGRRMHSPATHQRRVGRSTSSSRLSTGAGAQPRDSALEIVPLRSVSATRSSRGFVELADLREDDLGSSSFSAAAAQGQQQQQLAISPRREVRRRSAMPMDIPLPSSNVPSDSDRSRSRSRSRVRVGARPALSRSSSATGPGASTGSPTTEVDRRGAVAKF